LLVESHVPLPSLPEVAPGGRCGEVDLAIALSPREGRLSPGAAGWLVERWLPGALEPYLRVAGDIERHVLVHTRGLDVELTGAGRCFTITHLDPALDPRDVEHLLLDQLLPLVIGRLGRLSLHGSAVAWGDEAVAFLGPSGAGKSTLAAHAVRHGGARLVADDQVILEPRAEEFIIHPAYPSVRLWSDSAGAVFEPRAEAERKHRIELPTVDGGRPLRAVAVIERGPAVHVAAERPSHAIAAIAPHVDRLDPGDRAALRRELEMLSRLSEVTRILRVTIPAGYDALAEALDVVRLHALAEPEG